MAELMEAIARNSQPATSGADNLKTMALIEAGYLSIQERRSVSINEAIPKTLPDFVRADLIQH
jgi:predicted dehydrogenase